MITNRSDKLSMDAEHREDLSDGADFARACRGSQLADLECAHGRLPGDAVIDCDCWGDVYDPMEILAGTLRKVQALLAGTLQRIYTGGNPKQEES